MAKPVTITIQRAVNSNSFSIFTVCKKAVRDYFLTAKFIIPLMVCITKNTAAVPTNR